MTTLPRSGVGQGYHTFPPAFDDNPYTYAFALFSLILVASISLAHVVRLTRSLQPDRDGWKTPITIFRLQMIALFLTLFIGTFPDVVVLLLWNEISDPAMVQLWALDRMFDGAMLVPFLFAVLLGVRSSPRIVFQLIRAEAPGAAWPTWIQTKEQLWVIGLVLVIAAGVAWGKM